MENSFCRGADLYQVEATQGGVVIEISSKQNPRIKAAAALKERRQRKKRGRFLIEGVREVERACQSGIEITELFLCQPLLSVLFSLEGIETFSCTEEVFAMASYRENPDGVLAVAKVPQREFPRAGNPLYLIAEAVEKPGNLGAMLRTADATGATGVVVCDPCTDVYNPNVVRASTGTLFTQPVVEATSEETIAFLKEQGVRILAATPSGKAVYTDEDMTGPLAIVVGTEATGLSEQWLSECDCQVTIPMLGKADSLNVATATALLLYEAVRQRS